MANRRSKTTEETPATTAAPAPEASAENTEEGVELTVNDLAAIKQIIDIAS